LNSYGKAIADVFGPGYGGGGAFGGRRAGRKNLVQKGQGSPDTERSVRGGLGWLARHQHPDGHWDCDNFSANCHGSVCDGPGLPDFDTGVTGLAVLAFLGAGITHTSRDTYSYKGKTYCYGRVVKNGIKWLLQNQDNEGCVGGKVGAKYMYNHACGALALVEIYGMTRSIIFKEPRVVPKVRDSP
jgi:hypothetical protein